jgi:hypothetical protein
MASVHASQAPLHALAQHTPSAQKPLAHSFALVAWQEEPGTFLGTHWPLATSQY